MRIFKVDLWISLAFLAGTFLVLLVYWPGLAGSFIFDDFHNLSALGTGGGITDLGTLKDYLLSGAAGPTGRPVSLLTFLLDANYWPADPFPFKYTNLLIHALNGVLLFWLMLSLLRVLEGSEQPSTSAKAAALASSLIWVLHPYLVSTTLYAVQRMAQLPLLFSLIAALVWLHGRRLVAERPVAGYLWMTGAISIGGLLATFSKENGALLPLLFWAVEATVVRTSAMPPLNAWWRRVFFVLPAMLIAAYLIYVGFKNGWLQVYPGRDFSPYERLLTETRVLFSYLYQWFIPHLMTAGLFYDGIEISRGLLSPLSTIFSVFGTFTILGAALLSKKKYPLFSLAILFFFISQVVESTTIGLEIKFEHRMYAGSILLFLPLLYFVWQRLERLWATSISIFLVAVMSIFCWQRASLWADHGTMLQMWVLKAPSSARARVELATQYFFWGSPTGALNTLDTAVKDLPGSFHVRMSQVLLHCQLGVLKPNDKAKLLELAEVNHYQPNWIDLFLTMMGRIEENGCKGVEAGDVVDVADAFLSRPPASQPSTLGFAHLTYIKGVASLQAGENENALAAFAASLASQTSPQKLMNIARYLANYKLYDDAQFYAKKALQDLEAGNLRRVEFLSAPKVSSIKSFLQAVEEDKKNGG